MTQDDLLKSKLPLRNDLSSQAILKALVDVIDPKTESPLIKTDRLTDVLISENRIRMTLRIEEGDHGLYEQTRIEMERLIKSMPAAQGYKVFIVMTAHKSMAKKPVPSVATPERFELSQIKNIIAIASGKGGVGKSTTTVNLAYALRDQGVRVGILDADIYGPSIPKMLSINHKPDVDEQNHMIPVEKEGIQLMSMGFLMAEDTPVIWRGPIAQKAIQQFLSQVRWFNLDVLLIDMPPGTGDIHLTLVKKASITGAVIVSTPQDVALIDAKKAIGMFEKVETPILGIIENMSYFQCPHCTKRSDIFSHGGGHKVAHDLAVPFLAEIPLKLEIRQMTDEGHQATLVQDKDLGAPYREIATNLLNQLEVSSSKRTHGGF